MTTNVSNPARCFEVLPHPPRFLPVLHPSYTYAKGGSSGEENLRVLCRGHNLLSAEREFGEEFMRGKIEGQRIERTVVR